MADKKGKELTTIVNIAGRVDPSLGSSIKSASSLITQLTGAAVADIAAVTTALWAGYKVGEAVVEWLDASIEKAIAWEDRMSSVVKVTDGMRDAAGNYTDLYYDTSAEIRDLASKYPIEDMYDLADASAAILQDGTIGIEGLTPALEDAIKSSIALDVTIDEAAKYLSTFRLNLHEGEEGAYDLAQAINYLGENSGRTPAEITEMTAALSGVSEIAGIDTEQLVAMAAAIPGIDPSRAATSMKNFMLVLESGSAATANQKSVFKKLGLDAVQFAKDMQADPMDAMDDFIERFNKLDEAEKVSSLKQLMGSRAVEGAAIFMQNYDQYKAFLASLEAGEQNGSIEREVSSKSNTAAGAKQMLQNEYESFQIEVGTDFLPIKTGFYNAMHDALIELRPSLEELSSNVASIFTSGTFTGALETAFDDVIKRIKAKIGIFNWLGDKLGLGEKDGKTVDGNKKNGFGESLWSGILDGAERAWRTLNPLANFTGTVTDGLITVKHWEDNAKDTAVELAKSSISDEMLYTSVAVMSGKFGALKDKIDSAKKSAIELSQIDVSGSSVPLAPQKKTPTIGPKQFATGGFASSASIFGERGLEAAISFDPNYRSENIGYWAKAGQMLGVLGDENPFSGNGGVKVEIGNVTYDVRVQDGSRENVVRALRDNEPEFIDMIIEALSRWRRGNYDSADSRI